jgi:hypothetical protein
LAVDRPEGATERVGVARFIAVIHHLRSHYERIERIAARVAPDLGNCQIPDRIRDDRSRRDGVATEAEKAGGVILDNDALGIGLLPAEVRSHAVHLATVRRFEIVVVAARGIATRGRYGRGAPSLRGPRAVHAIVVNLPALAADLPLRVLVHDLEEPVGARHREDRRPVAGEVLDDALPKLRQNPGVDVEEAQVDLGILQVGVVGELRHHAVAVAEGKPDVIRGAFDVLRDQNVGAGLADPDQAREV